MKPIKQNHWAFGGKPSAAPPANAKIAIVDDEPSTILIVKKYLGDAGFSCFVEIQHATEAVTVIDRELPDLVLLDLHMPGKSGMEILRQLRAGEKTSRIPVLILTAERRADIQETAADLNANDFLLKPVEASQLQAAVETALASTV